MCSASAPTSSRRGSCDRLSRPKTRSNNGVVRYLIAPPAAASSRPDSVISLRQVPLRRLFEQPRARLRSLASRAERPTACDVLQDDPAPALGVALAHEAERGFDPLRVIVRGLREILDG